MWTSRIGFRPLAIACLAVSATTPVLGMPPLPGGLYVEDFDFGELLSTSVDNPKNLRIVDPTTWFGGDVVAEYDPADDSAGYSDLGVLLGIEANGDGVLIDVVHNKSAKNGVSNGVLTLAGSATGFTARIAVQNDVDNGVTPYGEGTGVIVDLFSDGLIVGSTEAFFLDGISNFAIASFDDASFDTIVFRAAVETPGAADNGLDTFAVDSIQIESIAPCAADVDDDGDVAFSDLLAVLATWGPCVGCAGDLDTDGVVGFGDLLFVLSNWGPCTG